MEGVREAGRNFAVPVGSVMMRAKRFLHDRDAQVGVAMDGAKEGSVCRGVAGQPSGGVKFEPRLVRVGVNVGATSSHGTGDLMYGNWKPESQAQGLGPNAWEATW